jgi:hypothetical protein
MNKTERDAAAKEGSLRLMSKGEIVLASTVFRDKIDYHKVWIHKDSYLPFGLQNEAVAMTPNGEIYYRPARYRDDFSDIAQSKLADRHTFIHELSHVWQRKTGMCVICRGLISWLVSYRYELDGRLLSEYPMEQQAQIIADNFLLTSTGYTTFIQYRHSGYVTLDGNLDESLLLQKYQRALRGFPW